MSQPRITHYSGKNNLPICNRNAIYAQVSRDRSKVSCKPCWDKLVAMALAKSEPRKPKRGLKQAAPPPKPAPVKLIMQNGQPLMLKRLKKILPALRSATALVESRLSPKQRKGSLVGVLAPLGSGGAPTAGPVPPQEPSPGERTG